MQNEFLRNFLPLLDSDGVGGSGDGGTTGSTDGAESGGESVDDTNQLAEQESGTQLDKPKYTEKELNQRIDEVVEKKWQKWQKKQTEAEKLAQMTAEEKAEHQLKQLREEIAQLKNEKNHSEMASIARKKMSDKGVNADSELIKMLISEDAETTNKRVDEFITLFELMVEQKTLERLKGKTPKGGHGSAEISKKEILKIKDPIERKNLIAENLHMFK